MLVDDRDAVPVSAIRAQRPLALLIPGLDGTGQFYEHHLEGLSSRFRALPWTFRPRARFDYLDLVEELGAAASIEPPRSITVVGESFGGTIALQFALARPDLVHGLVLINTFCYYGGRVRIAMACSLSPMLRWPGIREIKNSLSERLLASEGIARDGRERYRKVVALVDQNAYRRRLELVRGVDLRSRLCEVSAPTLILASGRDKIVPSIRSAHFMASRIPDSRVLPFPDAGHSLLLTPGFALSDYL